MQVSVLINRFLFSMCQLNRNLRSYVFIFSDFKHVQCIVRQLLIYIFPIGHLPKWEIPAVSFDFEDAKEQKNFRS